MSASFKLMVQRSSCCVLLRATAVISAISGSGTSSKPAVKKAKRQRDGRVGINSVVFRRLIGGGVGRGLHRLHLLLQRLHALAQLVAGFFFDLLQLFKVVVGRRLGWAWTTGQC